jgi:hypothetical protein
MIAPLALAIEATAPVLPAGAALEVSATFAARPLQSACRERQKVPRHSPPRGVAHAWRRTRGP